MQLFSFIVKLFLTYKKLIGYIMMSKVGRIKEERKRLGLTQQVVADLCGVHRVQWGRYEKGDQGFDGEPLRKFGEVGADVTYILTGMRQAPQDKTKQDVFKQIINLLPEDKREEHRQQFNEIEIQTAEIQAKRIDRYQNIIRLFNTLDDDTFDRAEKNVMDSYQAMVLRSK